MSDRDDDSQEPGFLDPPNLPKRRRAGRHHREYSRPPWIPRPQGTSPWTIIGWCVVGGILMVIFQVIVGTCAIGMLVSDAMRQSSY